MPQHISESPRARSRAFWSRNAGAWRTLLAAIVLSVAFIQPAIGQVVISQVYGGGGNSGAPYNADFVELFNAGSTPVSLAGLSIQYASATGTGNFGATTTQLTPLPGVTLAPGQYFLVQEAGGTAGVALPTPDATDASPIAMSATAGKVALVNGTTSLGCNGSSTPCSAAQLAQIIDLVGYGNANFFEGSSAAPTTSNTTAALRAGVGCTDTNNNSADFTAGAPAPRNTATTVHVCGGGPVGTNPTGTGLALTNPVVAGNTTLLTVAVTPGTNPPSTGIAVTATLSAIGGSAAQAFFDDGTHGDAVAGDNTFSYLATVALSTTSGTKSLAVSIADDQSRTGAASISLTVQLPAGCTITHRIPDIQGSGSTSPVTGQSVTTKGVVTARRSNGFFIQMAGSGDGDPATSDGIFVFTSSAPSADAAVGNTVCVSGSVSEYVPGTDLTSPSMTEIGGSPTVTLLPDADSLPAPVVLTAPLTTGPNAVAHLEALEGMLVEVPSMTVVAPTQGNVSEPNATASSNGVFYGVVTGVARPVRTGGLDINDALVPCAAGVDCDIPRFSGNPERIRVDSDGLTGASKVDVSAGEVLTSVVGPLDYAFRTYTILPLPNTLTSPASGVSATPVATPANDEVVVVGYNLERFFDTVADPTVGDPVLTPAAFANRLNKASLGIRNILKTPDVLGVVEVENLATLQLLATKINTDAVAAGAPDPQYAAYLVEGNDVGGIDVGFLVKMSRVSVGSVLQFGKDALYTYWTSTGWQTDMLNDRPPLVLQASVRRSTGEDFPFTVIVNHLRSMSSLTDTQDGPRVRAKRAAQAEYLATLVKDRLTVDPAERIILLGDFNAYQFNDGYVDMIGTIKGQPTAPKYVAVASPDLLDPDMVNIGDDLFAAGQQYSYVYDGNIQAIDHALVNTKFGPWVSRFAYAHLNADFPETYRNASDRPERLSDHDPSVTYLAIGRPRLATAILGKAVVGSQMTLQLRVTNPGTANAWNSMLEALTFRTLSGTGAVSLAGCSLAGGTVCTVPAALGKLAPGASVDLFLVLNVPTTVLRFSITEQVSIVDPGGATLRYSASQAVIR